MSHLQSDRATDDFSMARGLLAIHCKVVIGAEVKEYVCGDKYRNNGASMMIVRAMHRLPPPFHDYIWQFKASCSLLCASRTYSSSSVVGGCFVTLGPTPDFHRATEVIAVTFVDMLQTPNKTRTFIEDSELGW